MTDGPKLVSILRQGPYLIASVHTALDDTQMVRFQEDLIEQIGLHRSRGVIIDVAALDVLDSFGARTLRTIGEIAQTLVTIGVDLSKMDTIGDLQGGLEEAERLLGYSVTRDDGVGGP